MKQDLTQLVVVSDRSGSMFSGREDTEGSLNQMIEDQKAAEGECDLYFVEFDNQVDVVHNGPIKEMGHYTLSPRSSTALCDAVGKTIAEVGEKLKNLDEKDRPALVSFIISTDGFENASQEYTMKMVSDMIKHQKEKYNWQFTFIGVELDSEKLAKEYNIDINMAVSVARSKTAASHCLTSNKLLFARSAAMSGCLPEEYSSLMAYSQAEKEELKS